MPLRCLWALQNDFQENFAPKQLKIPDFSPFLMIFDDFMAVFGSKK
jgi:hypothetical protein